MKTVTIGEKEYQLEFTFEAAEHRGLIQSMFRILSGSYLVRRGTLEAQENEPNVRERQPPCSTAWRK